MYEDWVIPILPFPSASRLDRCAVPIIGHEGPSGPAPTRKPEAYKSLLSPGTSKLNHAYSTCKLAAPDLKTYAGKPLNVGRFRFLRCVP